MPSFWNWRNPALVLTAASALVLAFLLQRHLGLNPAVFADEWYYSKMARLDNLREAVVPSYLYLWVFRASNACGEGFLDCVRIGNAVFFIAATPFVYLTARAFTTAAMALLVTGLSLLAPLNLYTAFFMPETMYYFGFCVLGWVALACTRWRALMRAAACGAVLGLLSLVKVHALFLLPAVCLFLLYEHWSGARGAWLGGAARALATVLAVAFGTRFALGYLFAGADGLSVFGSLYGTSAANSSHRPLGALAAPVLVNLRGHLMALAVLFALPLALLAHGVAHGLARRAAGAAAPAPAPARLHLYTLLMLGAALGMTVLYTASISAPDNQEALRLHLRYYSFVFPLLLIACAAPQPAPARPAWRWALAVPLAAVLALALAKLPGYSLSMIDGPDISAIDLRSVPGLGVAVLGLAVLLLWAAGHPAAPRLFLAAVMPLALLATAAAEQRFVHQLVPSPGFYADEAGNFARRTIPKNELGETTVAGTGMAELFRVQFHLDDAQVHLLDLPAGATVDAGQLPPMGKWLLVVGAHPLPPGYAAVAAGNGYELARTVPRGTLVGSALLGGELPDGVVVTAQGLSLPEGSGRWSDGKYVRIRLAKPLPRHGIVVLDAAAYGPNSGLPFTLRAGAASTTFRVGGAMRQVDVRIETDGNVRELEIEVPQPVSPRALGRSDDQRALGIRLARIDVLADQLDLTAR